SVTVIMTEDSYSTTEDSHSISNIANIYSDHSSSDTDDGTVGHPRDKVWEYFNRTKYPKKKYYSAGCTFCNAS
ncbi:7461_t:CDS:1, partial [Dentiscutata heterogama]